MLLIALAAVVLSWLLTKRIIARWKRELEATERLLVGVCVFAAVFFIVAAFSIGGTYVYRQFARQMVSAISETADAIDDVRQLGDGSEEPALEPRGVDVSEKKRLANMEKRLAILELGGKVEVDEENPEKPIISIDLRKTEVTDTDLEILNGLTDLTTLRLNQTQITDEGLKHLESLSSLAVVSLGNTGITDAGLIHLRQLPSLSVLGLHGPEITDAGVAHIKTMGTLQALTLQHTAISDAGLAQLATLPKLRALRLWGTNVTDVELGHLAKCEGLEVLSIPSAKITDDALKHFRRLIHLQVLNIGWTPITDAGLEHLRGLTELTELNLQGTKVSAEGVQSLKADLPNCTIILTENDREVGDPSEERESKTEASASKRLTRTDGRSQAGASERERKDVICR